VMSDPVLGSDIKGGQHQKASNEIYDPAFN
jgi:hypothetical protein